MKTFDLDKTDRRMPYRVPDGFFASFEERVLDATAIRVPRCRFRLSALYHSVAAAAALAMLIVAANTDMFAVGTDFDDVARAYDNLSEEDREYLAAVHDYDLFINLIDGQQ